MKEPWRTPDGMVTVHCGDAPKVMATLLEASVDAIVTDPPYGLRFMNRGWDDLGSEGEQIERWHHGWAVAALRVLKPGGHLVAFGGTRTHHRLWCAVEDAGFEIRDAVGNLGMLGWVYGSGFAKSLDVSKAIDRAGEWNQDFDKVRVWLRQKVREKRLSHRGIDAALGNENSHMASHFLGTSQPMLPTWDQWAIIKELLGVDEDIDRPPQCIGYERAIIGYRKVQRGVAFTSEGPTEVPVTLPASDAASQWEGWGTGLKPAWEPILLARKPLSGRNVAANVLAHGTGGLNIDGCRVGTGKQVPGTMPKDRSGKGIYGRFAVHDGGPGQDPNVGRWPANVVLDEEAAAMLDAQSGELQAQGSIKKQPTRGVIFPMQNLTQKPEQFYGDSGGASRFFYCAKADSAERRGSKHPTIKPLDLMKWLVTLVTPPGGLVLDPFCGSGTTLEAAYTLGFRAIGIDKDKAMMADCQRRLRQGVLPVQPGGGDELRDRPGP